MLLVFGTVDLLFAYSRESIRLACPLKENNTYLVISTGQIRNSQAEKGKAQADFAWHGLFLSSQAAFVAHFNTKASRRPLVSEVSASIYILLNQFNFLLPL